jgi:ferrochelatase
MSNQEKIAVVLMNLGGPLKTEDIKPFLFNFFMDRNIIAAPRFIRYFIARLIAFRRGGGAALESYAALGGRSPLLDNTRAQAAALESALQKDGALQVKTFVSMRYWHPLAPETIAAVKEWGTTRVVLLPLYPQWSTTTSFSSFQDWGRAARKAGLDAATDVICCYPEEDGFITASALNILRKLSLAPPATRVLFSAHGLPENIIRAGDSYQHQCEMTAAAIVRKMNVPGLDWQICYQSRVGPLKWIGPSTEQALEKAAQDKVGVIVYPHAFVSEHVETLVEIEEEYREMAHELGIPYFDRVDTVSTEPLFIDGLARLVRDRLSKKPWRRVCPDNFSRCACLRNGFDEGIAGKAPA